MNLNAQEVPAIYADNRVEFGQKQIGGRTSGSITWTYVPLDLILPDQPNRAVRTRMLRGVGGAPCEGRPYPDGFYLLFQLVTELMM